MVKYIQIRHRDHWRDVHEDIGAPAAQLRAAEFSLTDGEAGKIVSFLFGLCNLPGLREALRPDDFPPEGRSDHPDFLRRAEVLARLPEAERNWERRDLFGSAFPV